MKLGELLRSKEFKYRVLVTVEQDEAVYEAIQRLAEYDRSSVTVLDSKGNPVGIVTERDIVRLCFSHSGDVSKIKVRDVMSKHVIIGTPEDDLNYAIDVMKRERIRHLPIVENERVLGIISMRDLLGVQLEACTAQSRFLNDYITGSVF